MSAINHMSFVKRMSCQNYLISGLSTTVAMLFLAQPRTPAQSLLINNVEPTEINRLAIPQQINIPPISQKEIAPVVTNEIVTNEQDLLAPPRVSAVISREMPQLWQMRVPIDQVGSLYANYELKAENGLNNAMSGNNSTLPVVIEALPIIEISRDPNSNTALIQGGVRLTMDLLNARAAGGYSGNLIVTVNQR
jgi:hypothetical protein